MGKKDNFNEAVYSMFGVGKAPADAEKEAAPAAVEPEVVEAAAPAVEEVKEAPKAALTRIAEGVSMEGRLQAKGDVEIAGHFKGDIEAKGVVTICCDYEGNVSASELCIRNCSVTGDVKVSGKVVLSEKSIVIGNVSAEEFVCCGKVKGDLDIQGNLNLKEKAQIEGNITMGSLMVEQGAVIEGSVVSKKKTGK